MASQPRHRTRLDEISIQEANHRISNNLLLIGSFVRRKASARQGAEVRDLLLDVAARIEMVGRLHHLQSRCAAGRVSAAGLLRDVRQAMQSIAGDGQLRIVVDCPETLTLPPDAALQLGLLTAELISNAAKYAHPAGLPTAVRIACATEAGEVTFTCEDDGIGLPEHFDPGASEGLGMRIIRSAVERLQGRCEWRDIGVGLLFVCRFPADASPRAQAAPASEHASSPSA